jgi:hypothetical protein
MSRRDINAEVRLAAERAKMITAINQYEAAFIQAGCGDTTSVPGGTTATLVSDRADTSPAGGAATG